VLQSLTTPPLEISTLASAFLVHAEHRQRDPRLRPFGPILAPPLVTRVPHGEASLDFAIESALDDMEEACGHRLLWSFGLKNYARGSSQSPASHFLKQLAANGVSPNGGRFGW